MRIVRRVGHSPRILGNTRATNAVCPDVFENDDGDFVIIGKDVTSALDGALPPDAGISADERSVVVPRNTLLAAAKELAAEGLLG